MGGGRIRETSYCVSTNRNIFDGKKLLSFSIARQTHIFFANYPGSLSYNHMLIGRMAVPHSILARGYGVARHGSVSETAPKLDVV